MTSVREIRLAHTEERRALDKGSNIWLYLVIRRLSFYPTWACLSLGISANQATFVSIVSGLLGCLFLVLGGHLNIIIGALLVNTWSIFDCVDGNIARFTKSYSKYGWFLDSLAGVMMNAFLLMSIGIGVFNHPDYIIHFLKGFSPIGSQIYADKSIFLILGAAGSLAAIFYSLVIQLFKDIFSEPLLDSVAEGDSERWFYPVLLRIGKYVAGFGLIEPMLLVAAVFNCPSLLVVFYALTNTSAAVFVIAQSLRKAKKVGGV